MIMFHLEIVCLIKKSINTVIFISSWILLIQLSIYLLWEEGTFGVSDSEVRIIGSSGTWVIKKFFLLIIIKSIVT